MELLGSFLKRGRSVRYREGDRMTEQRLRSCRVMS